MSAPVLFVIDEDPRSLHDVERELVDRSAWTDRVVCVSSAEDAKVELGKVKLTLKITFTPAGGAPNTESTKVTLKKLVA